MVMTPGSIINGDVSGDSTVAYAEDVTYTIEFQPVHDALQNGQVEVTLPTGMTFSDSNAAESGCTFNIAVGTPTCVVSGDTITFSNVFDTDITSQLMTITIPGIQNIRY